MEVRECLSNLDCSNLHVTSNGFHKWLNASDFTYLDVTICVFLQALLEFLSKVVSREKRNRMNLWAVATIMAPNLFLHKAVPSRLTEGAEKGHAEKAADVMRLLIRYQDLLWTVRTTQCNYLDTIKRFRNVLCV